MVNHKLKDKHYKREWQRRKEDRLIRSGMLILTAIVFLFMLIVVRVLQNG